MNGRNNIAKTLTIPSPIITAKVQKMITWFIALVWMVNGLCCKVLNMVPRHQQIVARIIGDEHAGILILLIGFSEMIMAIWIIIGFRSRLNAIVQIFLIAMMNTIEFIAAPDLLIWGRFNAAFALLLILLIYYNGLYLKRRAAQTV